MAEFGPRGQRLWDAINEKHELDAAQVVQLEEACHAADEAERMTAMLSERHDSKLQSDVNATRNLLKQLLAAMRLPDEATGKRPQRRTGPGQSGVHVPGGKVSSLDRARAAKAGA